MKSASAWGRGREVKWVDADIVRGRSGVAGRDVSARGVDILMIVLGFCLFVVVGDVMCEVLRLNGESLTQPYGCMHSLTQCPAHPYP